MKLETLSVILIYFFLINILLIKQKSLDRKYFLSKLMLLIKFHMSDYWQSHLLHKSPMAVFEELLHYLMTYSNCRAFIKRNVKSM